MIKKDKKRYDIYLNLVIVILTLVAVIWMFFFGTEGELVASRVSVFKYFTVDSNIFLGITSFLVILYRLDKRRYDLSPWLYRLRIMSVVSLITTFFVVIFVLIPSGFGIKSMLFGPNIIMHIFNPVLSFITFVFFEHNKNVSKKVALYGVLPPLIYSIIAIILVVLKLIDPPYPFLDVLNNSFLETVISLSIMGVAIIFICFLIKLLNDFVNR